MSETQGNLITHHNGWNPHFKYHHQLKTKEDAGGRSLGLQRGRRLRGEGKANVKYINTVQAKTMSHREEFNRLC